MGGRRKSMPSNGDSKHKDMQAGVSLECLGGKGTGWEGVGREQVIKSRERAVVLNLGHKSFTFQTPPHRLHRRPMKPKPLGLKPRYQYFKTP